MDRRVARRRRRFASRRHPLASGRLPDTLYAGYGSGDSSELSTYTLDFDRYGFYQFYDYMEGAWRQTPGDRIGRIRRTRFKPGYQRMWRSERRIIKEVTGLTNRYQYRLTTKLQKLFFETRNMGVTYRNISIEHAVLLSQFAPDRWSSDLLFQHQYVYLNGTLVTNPRAVTSLNDFIQLVVTSRFYLLNR